MIEDEPPIPVSDNTPPVKEQAAARGWQCEFFNFGKAASQGSEHFNPGLVRRPDGLWLLVRWSQLVAGMPYGKNSIWACRLHEDMSPEGGPFLIFPESAEEEHFEDPRAVYWNGQTWVSCVNFTWFPDGSWTGAHICVGIFHNAGNANNDDRRWEALGRKDPPVGTNRDRAGDTNGRHNKNWIWFFHQNKLHLIYTSDPWHVVEFGSTWDQQTEHKGEGVTWEYGIVRGGTPPILFGDSYYTFFHSSLPWQGRYRRYFMGAMAFEAKPPFTPRLWTREPILQGSQLDVWEQRKPLVVFPCGAIHENDQWTVTFGVNDLRSAWIRIPHEDLMKLLVPRPRPPAMELLSAKTTRVDFEHVQFNDPGCLSPPVTVRQANDPLESMVTEPEEPPNVPDPDKIAGVGEDRVYKPELLQVPLAKTPAPKKGKPPTKRKTLK